MAKLILQMNMSADGFVGDAKGGLDWMLPETDPKQLNFLKKLTKKSGLILLGRKMAKESIPHWEEIAKKKSKGPEVAFAQFFVDTPKLVFSKRLKTIQGKNTELAKGNLKQKVKAAKSKYTKNIIVYGGAGFVASLLKNNLIDELNLFIHPVALGDGLSIFSTKQKLKLKQSKQYNNGIILHRYKVT
jgi:dihydrofolate reductase